MNVIQITFQGLVIETITDYPGKIISRKGLSVKVLDPKQIRGYDESIARSTELFERRIVFHIEDRLGSKMYYEYIDKMQPLIGKNYLLSMDQDIIASFENDDEGIFYSYENGTRAPNPFIASEWIKKQEGEVQKILDIAKVITSVTSREGLLGLCKKYLELAT